MTDGFGLFIADMLGLYDSVVRELPTSRSWAMPSSRRALAVLRAYHPPDEGDQILIETAIEQFEDVLRRAGGTP